MISLTSLFQNNLADKSILEEHTIADQDTSAGFD